MSGEAAATLTLVGLPGLLLVVLTALGGRRRGTSIGVAVGAGVFFPVTWTAWYVRDRGALARQAAARQPCECRQGPAR